MSDTASASEQQQSNAAQTPPNADIQRKREAVASVFGNTFFKDSYLPVMVLNNQVLQSPHSIKAYKRDFKFISLCSALEYTYRSWKGFDQKALDTYAVHLNTKYSKVTEHLDNTIKRLEKLLKDHKEDATDMPVFFNVMTTDVPIVSSHANNFLRTLKKLDRIHLLAGKANMCGIIDGHQREEFERVCRKAVIAFATASRVEVYKVYMEANRLLRAKRADGQEVHADHDNAVRAHGDAISAFEASANSDAQHDTAADLQGQSADEFLDGELQKAANKGKKKALPNSTAAVAQGSPAPESQAAQTV